MKTFAGIDYGSKLSGNTVIAIFQEDESIHFETAEKKKDADAFILQVISKYKIEQVFLDAPLSLPGKYLSMPGYEDYFYRTADKELKAMSPMFLGGLTARAMRLKEQLLKLNAATYEVYPGGFVRKFSLGTGIYKKLVPDIPAFLKQLDFIYPMKYNKSDIKTWHHVDALIALISGYRFFQGFHEIHGNINEGVVII